jgi:hypothetical protein
LFESNIAAGDAKRLSLLDPYGGIFSPPPLSRFHQEVVSMPIRDLARGRDLSHIRTNIFLSTMDDEQWTMNSEIPE